VKVLSGRTLLQSIWYYLVEFDGVCSSTIPYFTNGISSAVGVLIISGGLMLFLIPFSLTGIGSKCSMCGVRTSVE
jgi:hypothetical protein